MLIISSYMIDYFQNLISKYNVEFNGDIWDHISSLIDK